LDHSEDVAHHVLMVSLMQQTLALHKQLPEAGTSHEKIALERQIEATDGQIDGGPALWADGGGDRDCERKGKRCGVFAVGYNILSLLISYHINGTLLV
jgi:protein involved in temperature-dependent protein secretion